MPVDSSVLQIEEYEKHCKVSYWLRASSELRWCYSGEELNQIIKETFTEWKKAHQLLTEAGLEPILMDQYLQLINSSNS